MKLIETYEFPRQLHGVQHSLNEEGGYYQLTVKKLRPQFLKAGKSLVIYGQPVLEEFALEPIRRTWYGRLKHREIKSQWSIGPEQESFCLAGPGADTVEQIVFELTNFGLASWTTSGGVRMLNHSELTKLVSEALKQLEGVRAFWEPVFLRGRPPLTLVGSS